MGCGDFLSCQILSLLLIWKFIVPEFTHLVVHKKQIKIGCTHQWVVQQLPMLCFMRTSEVQLISRSSISHRFLLDRQNNNTGD